MPQTMSSAGNTRGLIEAAWGSQAHRPATSLPRGIPAASLKRLAPGRGKHALQVFRLPRGIPAASLKLCVVCTTADGPGRSSAGNTRGLIEAYRTSRVGRVGQRLPRGIPAASLKPEQWHRFGFDPRGLPRGIPAASLKLQGRLPHMAAGVGLPRGIPAASLKPDCRSMDHQCGGSSAGNTRGLIEASLPVLRRRA